MTPGWLSALLPIVQTFGAWLVARRISWKHHPALITYLLTEALWQPLAWLGVPLAPWARVIQIPIRTAVVLEVLTYSRVAIRPARSAAFAGLGIAISLLLADSARGLTGLQTLYLARSYYHMGLCATLLCLALRRLQSPMLESRRHRAYRVGAAAWFATIAAAGAFVPGGLGYRFFPATRQTWELVDLLTYAAMIAVISAMTIAMTSRAPARKSAAACAYAVRARRMAA